MRRAIGLILILVSFISAPIVGYAQYVSNICTGDICSADEVGRFMQGITRECGNSGNCSLGDILLVFINVSYFVLGLIGAVVLVMYVIGGFYWLSSGGSSTRISKGKDFLKISTIGLLIVMFSYISIEFLLRTLTEGKVQIASEACVGKADGVACGENMQCDNQICITAEILEFEPIEIKAR